MIDAESRAEFRKLLNEQISNQVSNLAHSNDDSPTAVAKQRGIIAGLGMALMLVEPPPQPVIEEELEDEPKG